MTHKKNFLRKRGVPLFITITTTSTLATWSPTSVTNSGSTLHWEVTGAVTTSADANDPIFDFTTAGTKNITITSADDLVGLTEMSVRLLSITAMDLSQAVNLVTLRYDGNANLTSLNLTSNTALVTIIGYSCTNMTTLNLSGLTNLDYVQIHACKIASLNVTSATNLTYLECRNNLLTALDLTNNVNLLTLNATSNSFASVNLDNNTALTSLFISVTSISLTYNTALVTLTVLGSYTSIDLSTNTALQVLKLTNNTSLTGTLNISNNTQLKTLWVYLTNISTLDLTVITTLEELRCYNTPMTTFNVSTNNSLDYIIMTNMSSLTVSAMNNVILDLYANGQSNGYLQYSRTPSLTEYVANDVLDAHTWLDSNGWNTAGPDPA